MTMMTALAWPVSALVIAYLFRSELVQVLGRVGSLKYRGVEVSFDRELRKAEAEVKPEAAAPVSAPVPTPAAAGTVIHESDRGRVSKDGSAEGLYRAAILAPRAAIREAWMRVDRALHDAARARGGPASAGWDEAAEFLAQRGTLTPDLKLRLDRLHSLFQWADRAPDLESPTFADHARRYIDLARGLEAALRSAAAGRP